MSNEKKGGVPVALDGVSDEVLERAKQGLALIDLRRDIARLSAKGRRPPFIATDLGVANMRVRRILTYIRLVDVEQVTPEEIILRAAVDDTDRGDLVEALSQAEYTFDQQGPVFVEGPLRGTWNKKVVQARSDGLLTEEEYEVLRDAVGPPPPP